MKRKQLLVLTLILTGALSLYVGLDYPDHDIIPPIKMF